MAQRVLLVNKFYYPRGGDCVVTLNTERLLRAHGVDVGVYAMQYPHNVESQFSRYFASQISLGARRFQARCGAPAQRAQLPVARGGPDGPQPRHQGGVDPARLQAAVPGLHLPARGQALRAVLREQQAPGGGAPVHETLDGSQRRGLGRGQALEPRSAREVCRCLDMPQPVHGPQDGAGRLRQRQAQGAVQLCRPTEAREV